MFLAHKFKHLNTSRWCTRSQNFCRTQKNVTREETKFRKSVDLYSKILGLYPNLTGVDILGKDKDMIVKMKYSKVNLTNYLPTFHSKLYSMNFDKKISQKICDTQVEQIDSSIIQIFDHDNQKFVFKRKDQDSVSIERYDENGYQETYELGGCGAPYNDAVFGGISFNQDHTKIVFIAEDKNIPSYESYFSTNSQENTPNSVPLYKKWKYNDLDSTQKNNFGETLTNKKHPVIVVYDLAHKKIKVLDIQKLYKEGTLQPNIFDSTFPAHPIFDESGEGIIFHGYHLPIDRLGLNFALNRPTKLYYLKKHDLEEERSDSNESGEAEKAKPQYDVEILTKDSYFSGFAKFSSDYKYLSYFCVKEKFHTHMTAVGLNAIKNFGKKTQNQYQVVKRDYEMNDKFSGIYGYHHLFSQANFIKGTYKFMVSTTNQGKEIIILVDVEDKTVKILNNPDMTTNDSMDILKISKEVAFINSSSVSEPTSSYILTNFDEENPTWTKIGQSYGKSDFFDKIRAKIKIDTLSTFEGATGQFIRVQDHQNEIFEDIDTNKRPTILILHGGPHAYYPYNRFIQDNLLWLSLGYNLFVANYRGSLGFGLKFSDQLSGNAYNLDVADCLDLFSQCLTTFKEEIDDTKLGIYGGSHGGYLTCSIISHPEWINKFSAACIWNPVTAMHSAMVFSDLPDWFYSVACNKPHTWIMDQEDIIKMYEKSPISRLSNIQTPSLFIIGGDDRRCPDMQGIYFWRGLKSLGVDTDLHYYPNDGHSVPSIAEGIDAKVNLLRWWSKYL
ncbi:unnamed protein product [Moneuplotes crassus]|uniref:acylaminoacyl-peptidase n=1 Tax=Euplotes crassus TaxID=5936 RepID=A0AAD1Y579_EUPCR|nr:unnamed protein product [Moneuplotes crassus]